VSKLPGYRVLILEWAGIIDGLSNFIWSGIFEVILSWDQLFYADTDLPPGIFP
jgi:hypothetical protein